MKAVIYARYSSDNQTEASIEGQLRECVGFAESANLTLYICAYVGVFLGKMYNHSCGVC